MGTISGRTTHGAAETDQIWADAADLFVDKLRAETPPAMPLYRAEELLEEVLSALHLLNDPSRPDLARFVFRLVGDGRVVFDKDFAIMAVREYGVAE